MAHIAFLFSMLAFVTVHCEKWEAFAILVTWQNVNMETMRRQMQEVTDGDAARSETIRGLMFNAEPAFLINLVLLCYTHIQLSRSTNDTSSLLKDFLGIYLPEFLANSDPDVGGVDKIISFKNCMLASVSGLMQILIRRAQVAIVYINAVPADQWPPTGIFLVVFTTSSI